MLERVKASFINHNNFTNLSKWMIKHLPDEYIEYFLLNDRDFSLRSKVPGKYDTLLTGLFILSNFNPLTRFNLVGPVSGRGPFPAAYPAYTWGRWNDNIFDGDEPLPERYSSYEDFIQAQKIIINSGGQNIDKGLTLEFLLKRTIAKLERVKKPSDNIKADLCIFLDAMWFEYSHRISKSVLTTKELEELYAVSFGIPHNIMLIAFGSSARISDIEELSQFLGKKYNSEPAGLVEDLPKGICYIPLEVLRESNLTLNELMQNPNLTQTNPVLVQWAEKEANDCERIYQILLNKTKQLDWKARYYIKALTKI